MGDAIKHCMANLTNFDGKDGRATFWWWVLMVVLVTFGISMIASIGFVGSSVFGAISAAGAGADEAEVQRQMMQSMADGMATQVWVGLAVSLLGLALIVAAFARRLRDAGLPAFLVLIPVATTLFSAYQSFSLIDDMQAIMATGDMVAMNDFSMNNAASGIFGWIGYLVVIVGGLLPSKST